jgi:hypothetical protein
VTYEERKLEEKTVTIRQQNDKFRSAIPSPSGIPGQVMMTQGIQQLTDDYVEPAKYLPELFEALRSFNIFTEENDPYGDHSFGAFEFRDSKVFWKIDYYDADLKYGSEEPSDLTKTCRVLTIMLAQEY